MCERTRAIPSRACYRSAICGRKLARVSRSRASGGQLQNLQPIGLAHPNSLVTRDRNEKSDSQSEDDTRRRDVAFSLAQGTVSTAPKKDGLTSLKKEVRHELTMPPRFSVIDNLEFELNGDDVVLSGHVTRRALKTDAGRVVRRLEG